MTLYSVQVAKPMPYRIPTERIISLEDELTFKKMYKQKDMIDQVFALRIIQLLVVLKKYLMKERHLSDRSDSKLDGCGLT